MPPIATAKQVLLTICLVGCLGCLGTYNTHGCLQIDSTKSDGTIISSVPPTFTLKRLQHGLRMTPAQFIDRNLTSKGGLSQNDQGVKHMLEGKYTKSIATFLAIEETKPGKYETAANLGTAYELSGQNERALAWITEGINRNPGSHEGSEWIHVEILKYKIARDKQPDASLSSLLPLPDTFAPNTRLTYGTKSLRATDVHKHLSTQLAERALFIKKDNAVMAHLLFTLARLEREVKTLEGSSAVATLVPPFSPQIEPQVRAFIQSNETIIQLAKIKRWIVRIAIGGLVIGALVYAYRRKWLFLSRAAHDAHKRSQQD